MSPCDVKGAARKEKPTENYHLLASTGHFNIFQLIIWVLQLATLLVWFSLAAVIGVVSRCSRQPFSATTKKL